MTDTRIKPPDVGRYSDGDILGGYVLKHMIFDTVEEFRYPLSDADALMVRWAFDPEVDPATQASCMQTACEVADEIEAWLNENVAVEGFAFGWEDGSFYYLPISAWED